MPQKTKNKLQAARKSLTVWFSAAVPAILAAAEALKEQLPAIAGFLAGWKLVALSCAVSALVAYLRVRNVDSHSATEGK